MCSIRLFAMLTVVGFTALSTSAQDQSLDPPIDPATQAAPEEAESLQPQVVARLSSRFVNHFVSRDIAQWQAISQTMFGTRTNGVASVHGRVTAELVPDTNQAALDIRLVGTTQVNDNVGQRRSITIHSSAAAEFDARKRILISRQGISGLPAVATCAATVQIDGIDARRRIVERLAWRRIERMHGQIQEAAANTTRVRTAQQLDQELSGALAEADKNVKIQIDASIAGKPEFPCDVIFSSTGGHLQAGLVSRRTDAPRGGVELSPRLDVALGMHQSCVNNLLQFALGGKELKDSELLKTMEILTGNSPRELWVHDRTPRWSLTTDKKAPISVDFNHDRLSITARFTSVSRGTETLDRSITAKCSYRAEITEHGPHLVRDGDLIVTFTDGAESAGQAESLRKFVRTKLSGVFQTSLYFDGLVAPEGGTLSKLRDLELAQLSFRNGQGIIGYQLSPDTQIASN